MSIDINENSFQMLSPGQLHPNPWNSNVVSPDLAEKLKRSVQDLNLFRPIIARELSDGRLEIIGGQHRWEAASELELEKIPVMNLGPITDFEAKKISLADNARYGTDDSVALAEILEELGEDWDIAAHLPFDDVDLTAIFSTTSIDLEKLDELDGDENNVDPLDKIEKRPQTHRVMRFKLSVEDAERVSELINAAKKSQGFSEEDDLTNAGDALVHLILGAIDG